MKTAPTFGAMFRHARKAALMTQPEAARLVDVSPQTVSNWECERSEPWPSQQGDILAKLKSQAVVDAVDIVPRARFRVSDFI